MNSSERILGVKSRSGLRRCGDVWVRCGWSGAPLRAACDAHRYLRPIDLEADGGSASPCLKMMAREREALSNVLRQQATPWPLCVEDCKVLPDNPGGVLWSVVSVF